MAIDYRKTTKKERRANKYDRLIALVIRLKRNEIDNKQFSKKWDKIMSEKM